MQYEIESELKKLNKMIIIIVYHLPMIDVLLDWLTPVAQFCKTYLRIKIKVSSN